MPVENEIKILLHLNNSYERKIGKIADEVLSLSQGYLLREKGLTVRIRLQEDERGRVKYYFTTKQKVNKKIIEIEKKIDKEDYDELSKVALGWVHKVRYVVGDWEVDFFKDGKEVYFVMAEIEMPDGKEYPDKIPDFIMDNILFKVPREDTRFSSKKLSDIDYARKLLKEMYDQG